MRARGRRTRVRTQRLRCGAPAAACGGVPQEARWPEAPAGRRLAQSRAVTDGRGGTRARQVPGEPRQQHAVRGAQHAGARGRGRHAGRAAPPRHHRRLRQGRRRVHPAVRPCGAEDCAMPCCGRAASPCFKFVWPAGRFYSVGGVQWRQARVTAERLRFGVRERQGVEVLRVLQQQHTRAHQAAVLERAGR